MNPVDPASTDNLTAFTQLPLLASEVDLGLLLSGRSPAPEHLMTFLHEAAHHQCLRIGPLGPIPAYLECLAAYSASKAAASDEPEQDQAATLGYLALSRGATELLRPLDEGLALFSEFDALSRRNSEVTSLPLSTPC